MNQKRLQAAFLFSAALTLGACGAQTAEEQQSEPVETAHDHSAMDHSGSGDVPDGLQEAANPVFAPGSQALLTTRHMEGMDGAEATITGAYETTVYAVTYTPTTGGEPVENHKWVIHEELADPGSEPLQPGDTATLTGGHMEGMDGAEATIDSAEQTTVYQVDYTPTTGGTPVTNHRWVTGSELSPIE